MKVAILGSGFIKPVIFENEIKKLISGWQFTAADLPWPGTPRGNDDEIQEYAGAPDDVIAAAQDADALVTDLAPVNRYVLDRLDGLKFIGVARGGPVNINVDAATEKGVLVVNAPGRNGPAVAEYTVGLMLDLVRRVQVGAENLRSGKWQGDLYSYDTAGFELARHTVGLVGLGQVGSRVAEILSAFHMRVLVYDPFVDGDVIKGVGGEAVGFNTLLGESDIVSVHARLTDETRGMIGRDQFSAMRQGAYLINTARSPLIDYDALADAVSAGKLAGAAIDVYGSEPPDLNHPLLRAENVLALPHVGGATQESAQRGARMVAVDLKRYFVDGEKPLHCKNPSLLK
jgi:D-3-phosphoglycerate dehydrogenase